MKTYKVFTICSINRNVEDRQHLNNALPPIETFSSWLIRMSSLLPEQVRYFYEKLFEGEQIYNGKWY